MRQRTKRRIAIAGAFLVGLGGVLAAPSLLEPDRLSKPEYEQRVRDAYTPVQRAFAATAVARPELVPARLDAALVQLRVSAYELARTPPPVEVAHLHETLVDGMRSLADELEEVSTVTRRSGSLAAITAYNDEIATDPAVVAIAEAAETMKFMGYDLGRIAEE